MSAFLTNTISVIMIGIGATAILDLWAVFLSRAFKMQSLNFCMVGRWIGHMRNGTFTHANITKASQQQGECAVGWITHYLIGIVFAILTLSVAPAHWLETPTLTPALLVGVCTVILPFFIMQPALGFGVAGAKTPNPAQARLKSLMSHAVFGLGLYVSALVISPFLQTTA